MYRGSYNGGGGSYGVSGAAYGSGSNKSPAVIVNLPGKEKFPYQKMNTQV